MKRSGDKGNNNRPGTVPRGLVLVVDCMLIVAGYYAAYAFRFGLPFPKENAESLRVMLPWIIIITGTVFGSLGLYGEPPYNGGQTPTSVIVAVAVSELVTMAGAFWFRSFAFPRTIFGIALPIHASLITAWRHFVHSLDIQSHRRRKALIVSDGLACHPGSTIQGVPFANQIVATLSPNTILCHPEECKRFAADTAIILDSSESRRPILIQCLLNAGIEVLITPTPADVLMATAKIGQIDDHPVLLLSGFGLTPGQAFVKRLLDIAVALPALVIAAPIVVLAAVAVLVTSGPPVLYSQVRVGLRGREFRLYKLRTMVNGAESATGAVLSSDRDPRVTPTGKILRALRIDELPQLVNVLLGDMSVVGPRPERPELVREIERSLPEYRSRLLVKPGLTGLAQVKGNYSTRPEDKILFDLMYIADYSLVLDLMIALQTIAVVLTPERARGVREQPDTSPGTPPVRNTPGGAISN